MSGRPVRLHDLHPGDTVQLLADDGEYFCQGIVHATSNLSTPNGFLRLKDCKDVVTGKKEPGLQYFLGSDIGKLTVMPEETGKEQKTGPSSETTHSAKQSSSAKGRKEIFFSRRGTTRTDNSHLKELHSLDMKMLLSQKQISDELRLEQKIAVALEGQGLGRNGKLSLISFATEKKVFLFDFVKAGPAIFERGLASILETGTITKVFHDVRFASDMLSNKFDIELANVTDTMAWHSVLMTWALYAGYVPKYAISCSRLVRAYFGVTGSDLFFPHFRQSHFHEDTKIWLKRPLPVDLEIGAARNVMYLLDLYRAIRKCLLAPYKKANEVLLASVRDADDYEADRQANEDYILPQDFQEVLPSWEPHRYRAERSGIVEDRVVHQIVGQTDPLLIYSRDCLHQKVPKMEESTD